MVHELGITMAYQKHNNNQQETRPFDFNCDLAQSFGVYKNEDEFELLDYVSSVNVSCGFHAGDPITIKDALLKVKEKGLIIGAHIGFADIQGFGHREMKLSADELEAVVIYQVGALLSFAKAYNIEIEHVRPHGAMYKMASEDYATSHAIASGIKKCSKWLTYFGSFGETIQKVGEDVGVVIAQELHLDKIYNPDCTIDFTKKDVTDVNFAITRLQGVLRNSKIYTNVGSAIDANIDTIHFSNKGEHSIELVKRVGEIVTPMSVNALKAMNSGWV